jgi:hypothetical protein
MLHPPPSYSAKAEYPVRRNFSTPSLTSRTTGSSAGACHRARIRATRWRMMTAEAVMQNDRHTFAISRHAAPEFCKFIDPQKEEGAGKTGCALHPRSRVQGLIKTRTRAYRSAEAVRPSLRNGFTAYIVLSPARLGLFVTVAPKKRELLANLTPAIGASGPHDFAVRFSHARQSQLSRPSLPDPRFVTNAHTPLLVGRDGARSEADLPSRSSSTAATHWHDGQITEMLSRFIC